MTDATKIIPFPSRAKPRAIPTKSRLGEFVKLSETMLNARRFSLSGPTISSQDTGAGSRSRPQE